MELQLLIVDDEKLTKDGLTNYIDWKGLGITQVHSASNGVEALEVVKTFAPDILLTDVKMPHMNGIELAYKIQKLFPSCKIVFLSGYADKEYLKAAIDLKAETYIEKPVILNTVSLSISKVIETVRQEKQKDYQSVLLDSSLNETRNIVCNDIVQNLVSPTLDIEEFKRKFVPTYFTWQDNSFYLVVCIRIHSQLNFLSVKKLCFELNKYFINNKIFNQNDYYIGITDNNYLTIICNITYSAVLHNGLTKARDFLKKEHQYESTIVIGPTVHSLDKIAESHYAASHMLEYYHMYFNYQSILECHFNAPEKNAPEELFLNKNYSLASIEQLFEILKKEHYTNINFIKKKLYEIYSVTAQQTPENNVLFWEEFKWYTLQDYAQLICYGLSTLEDLYDLAECHVQVKHAIQYMHLNFMDSTLSIKSIADEVDLSQNYFCSLFKQNIGITASDYLLNIRLERVRFLLRNSDLKLYEIADKVGIPDSNYLNTLFKKNFGMTPTQYRKGLS